MKDSTFLRGPSIQTTGDKNIKRRHIETLREVRYSILSDALNFCIGVARSEELHPNLYTDEEFGNLYEYQTFLQRVKADLLEFESTVYFTDKRDSPKKHTPSLNKLFEI